MSGGRDYPDTVVDKILQLTLQSGSFAYLSLDIQGRLVSQGGELAAMGLPALEPGQLVADEVLFLNGMLPLQQDYDLIEAVQVGETGLLDVHLFRDGRQAWVILFDRSGDLKWEASARQSGNELRLLKQQISQSQEREAEAGGHIDLFESLSMMAFCLQDDDSFERLEPVPKNFAPLFPEAVDSDRGLYPQRRFPFVDNFLVDAGEVWRNPQDSRRLRSGPWIETDTDGNEHALEAIALNWKNQRLLFLEMLGESYEMRRSFLQIGREGVLNQELLEKEVRKQTREIRAREEEIALRLVCAADSRDDGETGSHIRRLGLYSELLAHHLGWSETEAEEIRIAAPMHDIGKIGIPDHILKKPGQLTESEFEIMKLHPEIGGRILSNSDAPLVQMARDICLGHHEKWDGSGYPRGLAGEAIPVSARIVAIVDVFDALIHKRVYKDEIPVDAAIELLQQGRGTHFDPEILDLFLELKDEMTEIAFDFSDPLGDDRVDPLEIIGDTHLLRPAD